VSVRVGTILEEGQQAVIAEARNLRAAGLDDGFAGAVRDLQAVDRTERIAIARNTNPQGPTEAARSGILTDAGPTAQKRKTKTERPARRQTSDSRVPGLRLLTD